MNLCFDQSLGLGYKSNSQKIRVMSESWVNDNIFCPVCGNARISKLENNRPVADFQCPSCGEIFELKSKDGRIGRKNIGWCIRYHDKSHNQYDKSRFAGYALLLFTGRRFNSCSQILLYTYSNRKEKTVIANCQTCWMGRLQYFVR